jgi:hypothetical protein
MKASISVLPLLLVACSIPASAQGADKKNEGQSGNQPTDSVLVIREQAASDNGKNAEPTKNNKDEWDKAAVLSNYLLVVVGGFGVLYAARTLRKLREQTAQIERQAGLMERQLTEMQTVSELEKTTLILQYRPKIIVRNAIVKSFSDEIGDLISKPVRCVVAFQIANIGGSPAHIVEGDVYLLSARLTDLKEEIELKESTHTGISERTLQPGERENIQFGLDTRIPNDARWVEYYSGASSHSIFLLGTIWYRDNLDIPRATGIHRKYDPATKRFEPKKDNEEEYSD